MCRQQRRDDLERSASPCWAAGLASVHLLLGVELRERRLQRGIVRGARGLLDGEAETLLDTGLGTRTSSPDSSARATPVTACL
jgi:hypothetical protein